MAYPSSPAPNAIEIQDVRYLSEQQAAEDGTVFSYLRNTKMLITWRLTYQLLIESNQALLWAWYESVYGNHNSDTWTNPETGVQHTVRCKSMRVTDYLRGGYGLRRRSMEVVLEEQP